GGCKGEGFAFARLNAVLPGLKSGASTTRPSPRDPHRATPRHRVERTRSKDGRGVKAETENSEAVAAEIGTMEGAVAATQASQGAAFSRLVDLVKRVFSFPAMLAVGLAGTVFLPSREFRVDPDIWWHIKDGQGILATHHWPTTDPYSF